MNHSSGSQIGIDKINVPPRPSVFQAVDIERRLYNVVHALRMRVCLFILCDRHSDGPKLGEKCIEHFFSATCQKLQPRNYIRYFIPLSASERALIMRFCSRDRWRK